MLSILISFPDSIDPSFIQMCKEFLLYMLFFVRWSYPNNEFLIIKMECTDCSQCL